MTCPKCGSILHITTTGKVCQNCGWKSIGSTGWVSTNSTALPLVIPKESLGTHLLETDIDVLLTRVSALEADLKRLKSSTRAKFENVVEQIGEIRERCDGSKPIRNVYIIREHTRDGWRIHDNVAYLTFDDARTKVKEVIRKLREVCPDYDADNLNIIQVKVRE